MGVVIPQVITEDKAGGAQVIEGSLRFDSGKSRYLSRTPASAGNRKTWTWSGWVRRSAFNTDQSLLGAYDGVSGAYSRVGFVSGDVIWFQVGGSASVYRNITSAVYRDPGAWMHIVAVLDTTQGAASDRVKLWVNGQLQTFATTSYPPLDYSGGHINENRLQALGAETDGTTTSAYFNGYLSVIHFIDGQALDPSYFGYTDPLTNTWRPKKLSSSVAFGTNGFYLPFDGNSPIGQDMSGKGNNWTPVNFGGSNTIEKATGALPILNTDGGGKVARVGVRTDPTVVGVASTCLVLALPLVGVSSDFSNLIDSRSTQKVVTANGNAIGISTISNFYGGSFYFDGSGDYLTVTDNVDTRFGTGDFTVEYWIYYNSVSGNPTPFDKGYTGSGLSANGWIIQNAAPIWYGGGSAKVTSPYTDITGKWYHYAFVRKSGTLTMYRDGASVVSGSDSTDYTYAVDLGIGANIRAGGGFSQFQGAINGCIQDVRIYKGVAKYTQNFIPASTDPDILPDTPSGVAYSSNVALVPSTDGAVSLTGVGGTYLQTAASGTDFTVGAGAFSIECYAYFNDFSSTPVIFSAGAGGVSAVVSSTGYLTLYRNGSGGYSNSLSTNQLSTGRWYHLAWVTSDGSQWYGYVNGVQGTFTAGWSGEATTTPGYVGTYGNGVGTQTPNAFISNLHVVKGTALYTSNFTPPTAPITSVTNTKLLCCKSQTSATAADVRPGTITANGNAAASNFNPFTVNINTQRGQESGYATWNPANSTSNLTPASGGLSLIGTGGGSAFGNSRGSIAINGGKYYWETTVANIKTYQHWGIVPADVVLESNSTEALGQTDIPDSVGIVCGTGAIKQNSNTISSGSALSTGDVIGHAFDGTTGKYWISINGVWRSGNPYTGESPIVTVGISTRTWLPAVSEASSQTLFSTFGQKPFKFPPPAGFQPLTLANTPRPTIVRPDQYVGVSTWSGAQSGSGGLTRQINIGFQPDFVWIKQRNQSYSTGHQLYDSVRGAGAEKELNSSGTGAEGAGNIETYGWLNSFDKPGFTVKGGSLDYDYVDKSGVNYVAWAWKAGGNSNTYNINDVGYATTTAAGLTAGTIAPTGASVNTKSGFSIITYSGSASAGTISHGLGISPSMIFVKERNNSRNWFVWHTSLGATQVIEGLNTTSAATTQAAFGSTLPTSSVFSVGSVVGGTNGSGSTFVAYCWAEIPGFSKFGSYTGNGSTDGPMIMTGFRPRWVMIKRTDFADAWHIHDAARNPSNGLDKWIEANAATAEGNGADSSLYLDFVANGFKIRYNTARWNASAGTYIYAAFAEAPSFNLYGGQANAR